ncbi:hypothetical protein [Xanthobacter aminoxidans]|uniref:hypothetical protein n=1 Tax=Xanthobacter aminoxidans TaxID=186280 RepID=UPI003726F7ED
MGLPVTARLQQRGLTTTLTLNALMLIEQVKVGITAFVDPVAVHCRLFPGQRAIRSGGNREGGRT